MACSPSATPGLQPAQASDRSSDIVNDSETLTLKGRARVRRVTMGVGKSMIVDLPADAGEIFVGNPAVANAVVRSARKIYIIGHGAGQTTIYAMDKQGRRMTHAGAVDRPRHRPVAGHPCRRHAQFQDRRAHRQRFDHHDRRSRIRPATCRPRSTSPRASPTRVNKIGRPRPRGGAGKVVNAITIKGRDTVMIKVTVAEIQRSIAKQLGISSSTLAGSWGILTQANPFTINGGALSTGALTTATKFGGPTSLTQTLQAFESSGVARTLAEPTVTAVSGENAKFTVGGEIPISGGVILPAPPAGTTTQLPALRAITFKTYGVTLNFTPVVLASGRISLRLATEVAEVDPSTSAKINGETVPGFRTRRHETTVELPTGGSIATAGLIQQTSNQAIAGVPGAMNLPILGALFRSRDYQRQETELMIIVTPYIVKSVPASALARPDENFADANDPQAWLLGRVNKLYSTTDNPEAARHFNGRVGFIHD